MKFLLLPQVCTVLVLVFKLHEKSKVLARPHYLWSLTPAVCVLSTNQSCSCHSVARVSDSWSTGGLKGLDC